MSLYIKIKFALFFFIIEKQIKVRFLWHVIKTYEILKAKLIFIVPYLKHALAHKHKCNLKSTKSTKQIK